MRRKANLHKRMYAVSKDGIGLIAGTMAYSRKAAIAHFIFSAATMDTRAWERFKRTGYRTVMARVEIIRRTSMVPSQDQGAARE